MRIIFSALLLTVFRAEESSHSGGTFGVPSGQGSRSSVVRLVSLAVEGSQGPTSLSVCDVIKVKSECKALVLEEQLPVKVVSVLCQVLVLSG